MKAKYESSYDEYFPDESKDYYSVLLEYAQLTETNYSTAHKLALKSLILSDRYNTIGNDATKLDSIKTGAKTDRQKFFYGRYRVLREIHTHARMIWKAYTEDCKSYGNGVI
jgi:hypothetical protein